MFIMILLADYLTCFYCGQNILGKYLKVSSFFILDLIWVISQGIWGFTFATMIKF